MRAWLASHELVCRWKFGWQWGTRELRATPIASRHGLEVGPGSREAERPVRTTANAIGIVVVLAVVLPEADRTDLVGAPLGQGEKATAGGKLAVDDLTFSVHPGVVTGFLGPNGAGKSTTMRMIMGLDASTWGTVTANGKPYAEHPRPLHEVGALLEAWAVHTGRSARNHLLAMAATAGIGARRVEEVIDMVGLTEVASKRVGSFSLGMGQRVGIASALLGDPETLILDEPVNGLDPDGVRWIRNLLRGLADEGRTVFLSSHLMSEMALTADHVIVVGRGRLLRDQSMSEFTADASTDLVRVRSPQARQLAEILAADGVMVSDVAEGVLEVTRTVIPADRYGGRRGPDHAVRVGDAASVAGRGVHGPYRGFR